MGQGLLRTGIMATESVDASDWIALVPHEEAEVDDHLTPESEVRLLQALHGELPGITVPGGAVLVHVDEVPVLVMQRLSGAPLDAMTPASLGRSTLDVSAEMAASVHALPPGDFAWLRGSPTRLAHAETTLDQVAGLQQGSGPLVAEALAWMKESLPPAHTAHPARLLHGDLLGQNILCLLDSPSLTVTAYGLIDWAAARIGDPAYDLAIATRCVQRPFKEPRGLERLLEAYEHHGGASLTMRDVRFYEIAMLLKWHAEKLQRPGGDAEARSYLQRVRALLRST